MIGLSFSRRLALLILICAVAGGFFTGCGRKGPPRPPDAAAVVGHIEGAVQKTASMSDIQCPIFKMVLLRAAICKKGQIPCDYGCVGEGFTPSRIVADDSAGGVG
jgi:predicted small lipoprotein YifL